MTLRTLSLLLAAGLALTMAPTGGAATYADCVDLVDNGQTITACGEVTDGVCGTGSGSGQATAAVHWRLTVYTQRDVAHATSYGQAAALTAQAPCWTDTCTTVVLYANDVEIVRSMTLC